MTNPYEDVIDKALHLIQMVRQAQRYGLMKSTEPYLPPAHEQLQRAIGDTNDSMDKLLAEVRTEVHAHWSAQ